MSTCASYATGLRLAPCVTQCEGCAKQDAPRYPLPAIQYRAHFAYPQGMRGLYLVLRERMSSGLWFAIRIWK